jgi:hypothetical protein
MAVRADEHAGNVKRNNGAWSKKLRHFSNHLLSKLTRIQK